MNRLAWATDIHLNFLEPEGRNQFYTGVAETEPDLFVISGDIAEAPTLVGILDEIRSVVSCPIYFVLGNHDFYFGSIHGVRTTVADALSQRSNLIHLNTAGIVELNPNTAMIGHDGWADGRVGDFENSPVRLNDHLLIEELSQHLLIKKYRVFNRANLLREVKQLGDEAADYLATELSDALASYRNVIVVTHVPPFKEVCRHHGPSQEADWFPHFVSKCVGDVLRETMRQHPKNRLLVLAGHTHTFADVQIMPNLRVRIGSARYRHPRLEAMLDLGDVERTFTHD